MNNKDEDTLTLKARTCLSDVFPGKEEELHSFRRLSDGISNVSMEFFLSDEHYVLRIPDGIGKRSDRWEPEKRVYQKLKQAGVTSVDMPVFFDEKRGIKVTPFLENTYYPQEGNQGHLVRSVNLLRDLHSARIDTGEYYILEKEFLAYEDESDGGMEAVFPDYSQVREKLLRQLGRMPVDRICLCHMDPILYNFLLSDRGDYLIDFEYSMMASPLLDLAAMSVYRRFDRQDRHKLLRLYFNGNPDETTEKQVEVYVAAEGMMAALWYYNRREAGEEMGVSMMESYQFAHSYFSR